MKYLQAHPKISFVIPLYNHLAETREMLASLQASLPLNLEYEIILVDDGSTDDTRVWLQGVRDTRIRTHLNEKNFGYAASNNIGVRLAQSDILGLLNSDLLFEPGWLEPMLELLLSPSRNAAIVGNLQYRVSDGALDHAGICLIPEAQFHHIKAVPVSHTGYVKALAVTGACMLIRKSDFDAVGGFDEQYLNGCEDIDLCFKLRALRKEILLATESRIHHHVSLSRKVNTLQDFRNSRHLFSRWRKEIKQELSAVWRRLLAAGAANYADKLSGQMSNTFVETPHIASFIIAETMLRREESEWARKLEEAAQSHVFTGALKSRGLRYVRRHNGFLLEKLAEFFVDGTHYIRNFYICGHRLDDTDLVLSIVISVNGLHAQAFQLYGERNVNVGIINPILLPGIDNCIWVDTSGPIVLTHVVIDDQAHSLLP